jgi:hypothetical protein
LQRISKDAIAILNNSFYPEFSSWAGMRIKIIIIPIMALYAISILPLLNWPYGQKSDLGSVIQLIQKLADSSNSEQSEFSPTFYASLNALRLTAGIKVLIVDTPQDPQHEPSILIIDGKPPHLLLSATATQVHYQISESYFPYIHLYTSLSMNPPTPPPQHNC